MLSKKNYLNGLLTLLFLLFINCIYGQARTDSIKTKALAVLKIKCNVCHITKNQRRVFTVKNMNDYAKKIHQQVFISGRMPKNGSIPLTKKEKQALLDWIKKLQ